MALIGMEARQSGLLPFTSAFSKSAIEQRVKAIMKLRKTTVRSVVAALVVVCSVVTVFATSAMTPREAPNADEPVEPRQNHATTDADYEKLLALRTDESLGETVAEFNEKLLRHMNDEPDFFDSYWAVQEDFLRGEGSYVLTEEERVFLSLTLPTSNSENAAEVKTAAGYPTKPGFTLSYQRGENGETVRLDCPVSYEILRPGQISVSERERWLADIHKDLTQWLDGSTVYELGKLSKEDVVAQIYRFTHTRDGDFAVDPADTESMTYTVARDMYPDGENQLPVGVYETAEAYLDALKRGDKEAALAYRYDDPDDPYRDELRGAFLESTDELNGFSIDGIEALGENLWQVNVTYDMSATGEQSVSNYVAYIDGSFCMILNSRNIPANLVPEGMFQNKPAGAPR